MSRPPDFSNANTRNQKSESKDVLNVEQSTINNNNISNINEINDGLVSHRHCHYGSNSEINNSIAADASAAVDSRGNISRYLHNHILKKDIKSQHKSKISGSLGSLIQKRQSGDILEPQLLQQASNTGHNMNGTTNSSTINGISNQRIAQPTISSSRTYPLHLSSNQQVSQLSCQQQSSARPQRNQHQRVPPQKSTSEATTHATSSSEKLESKLKPHSFQDIDDIMQQQHHNNDHHTHRSNVDRQLKYSHASTSVQPQRLSTSSQRERVSNDIVIKDPASSNSRSNQMDPHLGSGFNGQEPNIDALGSLERDLPVELSFLIRQQAYCMAKMNYLDRQIKELKEIKVRPHTVPINPISAFHSQTVTTNNHRLMNHQHYQHQLQYMNNSTVMAAGTSSGVGVAKSGNQFIPSDDSGGEYSRATISDDDELSSLLDQIAKTVKTERNNFSHPAQQQIRQQQQQHRSTGSYSLVSNCQAAQSFALLNHPYLHHQHHAVASAGAANGSPPTAMPVFLMSSPIALAAHPSSITSNILPGIHFQPETRYNQYYGDFFNQSQMVNNNNLAGTGGFDGGTNFSPMMNNMAIQHHHRQQQSTTCANNNDSKFDESISAIEKLIAQKEQRNIKSQDCIADNWFKKRSVLAVNHHHSDHPHDLDGDKIRNTLSNLNTSIAQVDTKKAVSSVADANNRTASTSLSSVSASASNASASNSPPINGNHIASGVIVKTGATTVRQSNVPR